MSKPIRISVDVTKLDKALFFRMDNGSIICDLVAWQRKEPGKRGETHFIKQSQPRDDKERQMPILGNLTIPPNE